MPNQTETIVLGGGCFWCTEAVFKQLRGVISVMPGYTGGFTVNPTYHDVSSGETGHTEAIKIVFDPEEIRVEDILNVFFATHDPTTLNKQGNDVGTQYRSAIYTTSSEQVGIVENYIRQLQNDTFKGRPITTEIGPLGQFYEAEGYHQDYYEKNPDQAYCQIIIDPKILKLRQKFQSLLK